jgi:hypothetical protein
LKKSELSPFDLPLKGNLLIPSILKDKLKLSFFIIFIKASSKSL